MISNQGTPISKNQNGEALGVWLSWDQKIQFAASRFVKYYSFSLFFAKQNIDLNFPPDQIMFKMEISPKKVKIVVPLLEKRKRVYIADRNIYIGSVNVVQTLILARRKTADHQWTVWSVFYTNVIYFVIFWVSVQGLPLALFKPHEFPIIKVGPPMRCLLV